VVKIEPIRGGGATVTTSDGRQAQCRRLLLCAGPWTKSLAATIGVDLPLTPERHCVANFAWAEAPRVSFSWVDLETGIYAKPEGTELFIVGTLHNDLAVNPDEFEQTLDGEIYDFVEKLTLRVPNLIGAGSRGGYAAIYDMSPDSQPVIGEIADGVFVDAGTSGHGFKLAPSLCREVANLVLGHGDPEIAQFHPRRFSTHEELEAGYGTAHIFG